VLCKIRISRPAWSVKISLNPANGTQIKNIALYLVEYRTNVVCTGSEHRKKGTQNHVKSVRKHLLDIPVKNIVQSIVLMKPAKKD